jgi:hypothetical protein
MSNEATSFNVTSKLQADLLAELLEKCAAHGPNARALADLYDEAQRVKKSFDAAT